LNIYNTVMVKADTPGALTRAADILRQGGLVAFPTETVYGLGALGLNPDAVARIYEAKERPSFDPVILHVAGLDQVRELAVMSDLAEQLATCYWPGPLTLVLPRKPCVPDIVTAGLRHVAVRIPAHPVALELLRAVHAPVAAPSANRFGQISPTHADHVMAGLSGRIDMILDGGSTTRGLESTIVRLDEREPVILRLGALAPEDIEQTLGHSIQRRISASRPDAPGQLDKHYAPRKPLRFETGKESGCEHMGLLTVQRMPGDTRYAVVEELAPDGNLSVAAQHLFAAMHRLDHSNVDSIVVRPCEDKGLGAAIMDRLRRAATSP
jgi:L-threonylcarbamoyladenylate synthase